MKYLRFNPKQFTNESSMLRVIQNFIVCKRSLPKSMTQNVKGRIFYWINQARQRLRSSTELTLSRVLIVQEFRKAFNIDENDSDYENAHLKDFG
jgi:hypothetical protein